MTAKLVTHEPNNERTFEVPEAGITIGRHADNKASLDDVRLSRFHARVFFRDGNWYAEDLGSTNGSFINGVKFEGTAKVLAGDKLRFGATEAELSWDPSAPSSPAAAEVPPAKAQPFPQPAAVAAPGVAKPEPAATLIAPVAELAAADLPAGMTPIAPEEVAAPAAPAAPAPRAPHAIPGRRPLIVPAGGLKPGLKLPPKTPGLRPGLKLPPQAPGLRPGVKLPPKPVIKPGLRIQPKKPISPIRPA